MSYTKIFLPKQDKHVYLCNQTNKLFNEDTSLVELSYHFTYDINEHIADSEWGSREKTNKPVRLRIILGQACNYDCTYCTQKDIGDPNERVKNDKLFDFITGFDEHIDRSELRRVELWGGEPFLYWNDMQPLMKFFDDENIEFYISTNGSTLMEKHIEFFNTLKGKISMTISHDGPGQEALRGDEIFDKPRVQKVVKMMDNSYPKIEYGFNSVITNTNYDLFAINDFFRNIRDSLELKHLSIGYEIGRTYESAIESDNHYSFSYENVIHGENLEKFKDVLREYFKQHTEQLKTFGEDGLHSLIPNHNFEEREGSGSVLGYTRYTMLGQFPSRTTNCGVDWKRAIDLDLNGNVRTCQNVDTSHISGNINNLKHIKIFAIDLDRKHEEHCSTCHVKMLCKSSCPIKLPAKTFLRNCNIEKIWYTEHLLASLNIIFDDEVSIVEKVILKIK